MKALLAFTALLLVACEPPKPKDPPEHSLHRERRVACENFLSYHLRDSKGARFSPPSETEVTVGDTGIWVDGWVVGVNTFGGTVSLDYNLCLRADGFPIVTGGTVGDIDMVEQRNFRYECREVFDSLATVVRERQARWQNVDRHMDLMEKLQLGGTVPETDPSSPFKTTPAVY